MDFKQHLETAWRLMLNHIVPLILMTLVMLAVSVITLGILAPVTLAGYMQSILLMGREGRAPRIQDIFSTMHLFVPLLVFSIAAFFLILLGFIFFVLPGIVLALALAYFCLYMIPLMIDKKLGVIDAVKASYQMSLAGNLMDNVVVAIIFFAVMAIGGSSFIGSLFTQPFATIFLLSVYEEKIGTSSP